jgi:HSF-type DNA-binding
MSMIHLVVSDSIRTSLNGGEHVKEGFSLVATMRRSYERRRHDGSDDDFLVGEGAAAPSAADPASSFEYASLSASAAAAAAMAMPPFAAAAVAAAAVAVPSYDAVAPSTSSSTLSHVASDPDMLFPNKLFVMLHDAHQQGFHDIVSWGKDSYRGFKVHRKRDFERIVLPKYFKMTKYKSFTRQLHNYEFLWIRMGNDKGGCKSFCARIEIDGMTVKATMVTCF